MLEAQTDETIKKLKSWPKSAKGLSSQLRRLATALRMVGIHVEFAHSGDRKIHIRKVPNFASSASSASKPKQDGAFRPGANETGASTWTQNASVRTQAGRNGDGRKANNGAGLDAVDAVDAKMRPHSHGAADGNEDEPREVFEL